MKHLLSIIGVLILALSNTACAQGTDKQSKLLDEALLSQATSVSYFFDNGTVIPDCRYDCEVTVHKDSVRLRVMSGYGEEQKYDSIVPLQSGQYEKFITRLVNHSITKVPFLDPKPVGGPTYYLLVRSDSSVVEGEEGYEMQVQNGRLFGTFLTILPPELQDIMKAPEQLLER
ncbi:MAG: hypothetical protein II751_02935 [Bacteroidales bacterium]|nr:hypothetical protein [Bacteroidales bacterium]